MPARAHVPGGSRSPATSPGLRPGLMQNGGQRGRICSERQGYKQYLNPSPDPKTNRDHSPNPTRSTNRYQLQIELYYWFDSLNDG